MPASRMSSSRRASAPVAGGTSTSPISSSKPVDRRAKTKYGCSNRLPVPRKGGQLATQQQFSFEDLKDILVNRVGLSEDAVKDDPNTSFEDMGLDSLAFVEIQLAVQQQYGFTISDEDAQEIRTAQDAIDYTNRRLAEQG